MMGSEPARALDAMKIRSFTETEPDGAGNFSFRIGAGGAASTLANRFRDRLASVICRQWPIS